MLLPIPGIKGNKEALGTSKNIQEILANKNAMGEQSTADSNEGVFIVSTKEEHLQRKGNQNQLFLCNMGNQLFSHQTK